MAELNAWKEEPGLAGKQKEEGASISEPLVKEPEAEKQDQPGASEVDIVKEEEAAAELEPLASSAAKAEPTPKKKTILLKAVLLEGKELDLKERVCRSCLYCIEIDVFVQNKYY